MRGLVVTLAAVALAIVVLINLDKLPSGPVREIVMVVALGLAFVMVMLADLPDRIMSKHPRIEIIKFGQEAEDQYQSLVQLQQATVNKLTDAIVDINRNNNETILQLVEWAGRQLSDERRRSIDLVSTQPGITMRLLPDGTGRVVQDGQDIAPLDIIEADYWYVKEHGKLPPVNLVRAQG